MGGEFMAIGVPLGLLGVISLGALYDVKMNMVAGAFWLLLSSTLAQWFPFCGYLGALIGISHLAYLAYILLRNRNARMDSVEVKCPI